MAWFRVQISAVISVMYDWLGVVLVYFLDEVASRDSSVTRGMRNQLSLRKCNRLDYPVTESFVSSAECRCWR